MTHPQNQQNISDQEEAKKLFAKVFTSVAYFRLNNESHQTISLKLPPKKMSLREKNTF